MHLYTPHPDSLLVTIACHYPWTNLTQQLLAELGVGLGVAISGNLKFISGCSYVLYEGVE